jgi:P-type Ca2+ transporter type 2C
MHDRKIAEVFKELQSDGQGLSDREAHERLRKYGLNELVQKKKASPIKIFFEQFQNFVVYILIAALLISIFIGFTRMSEESFPEEFVDAIVIGIIVILNAVFGFVQEYRAERSIEALKKMTSLKATVLREGKQHDIDAKLLVPGDIVLLEMGDKVPADARLLEIIELQTQEAALTGESLPVKKETKPVALKTSLADRINMVFSGTIVTAGKAKAIVTGTGMKTEIGKIATMIDEVEVEATPLQKKLDMLS